MSRKVLSQDRARIQRCARATASRASGNKLKATACANASALSAICTNPLAPYGCTTSVIDVETTGKRAARYSGVFVGLMYRVAELCANGSMPADQPLK